jgi:hypothetical protein
MTDVHHALQKTAMAYGYKRLAAEADWSYQTTRNTFCPTSINNHISLEKAIDTWRITGDYSAIHALNAMFGLAAIPIPENFIDTEVCLFRCVMAAVKSKGEFFGEIDAALSDSKISQNDWALIHEDFLRMQASMSHLMGKLKLMKDQDQLV